MFVITCMLLGASYGFSQNRVKVTPVAGTLKSMPAEQKVAYDVSGVVRSNGSGDCGTWIEVVENGRVMRLNPVNLPESFKVDGRNIHFDYGVTTNNSPAVCGGKAVYVQNVSGKKPFTGVNQK